MTLTLNGTSGVTTPGISNSEGYTGDGLTIAAGAPAGALQINSAGNAGLGVTPSAWLSTIRAIDVGTTGAFYSAPGNAVFVGVDGNNYSTGAGAFYKTNGRATRYLQITDGTHAWYTAPSGTAGNPITFTQAMTLDASGNLLVGVTSNSMGNSGFAFQPSEGNAKFRCGGANTFTQFYNNSGSQVGGITTNGSSTTYNTNSDYRLKENVQPMQNALDKIAALKPVTYNWKADGSADRGFIAHELQEVIPQAVSGEKDAVDAEGNIQPQGVDYGKITPELVAAIQEQQAMITELKARIEQLETK